MLHIRSTGEKGNGVFTTAAISKGETIEECPVLILSPEDTKTLENTILDNYLYLWGKDQCCIVFGYGMLYNHSEHPNVTVREDFANNRYILTALRDIKPNEELCHNYADGRPSGTTVVFTGHEFEFIHPKS
ncbi:MAG: SET domain-containing protein [Candidatus Peregrinibacteria bacterium]